MHFGDPRLPPRFWAKVQVLENGCWEWTGCRVEQGYGHFGHEGRLVYAHRLSLAVALGRDLTALALHHCDNPPCVNPNPGHLFEGTHADNMADMMAKDRGAFRAHYGEDHGQAKVTATDVRNIREMADGEWPQALVASLYGISQASVSNIVRRKTWGHVE